MSEVIGGPAMLGEAEIPCRLRLLICGPEFGTGQADIDRFLLCGQVVAVTGFVFEGDPDGTLVRFWYPTEHEAATLAALDGVYQSLFG